MKSDRDIQAPLVWDLPTRVFHWLLVVLMILAYVTAEVTHNLERHATIGKALLTLILFRVLWGFFGGRHARFSDFIRSPVEALRHLLSLRQPDAHQDAGHNAAGGWMVVVLLLLVGIQAGSGLFISDGILFDGPLASLISSGTSELLRRFHLLNFKIIMVAVLLHLLAIVTYRVLLKLNLVKPMVTGRKPWIDGQNLTPLKDRSPPLWRALLCAVAAIAAVQGLISLG